jgi:hypothetical protein
MYIEMAAEVVTTTEGWNGQTSSLCSILYRLPAAIGIVTGRGLRVLSLVPSGRGNVVRPHAIWSGRRDGIIREFSPVQVQRILGVP